MEFRDFKTGKDDDGRRLDRILRIFLKDKSLSEIYKLLRKGLIKVNKKKAKPEAHVNEGDLISIAAFLLEASPAPDSVTDSQKEVSPQKDSLKGIKIVFENEHLLIIDKPYGRPVHGGGNSGNSETSGTSQLSSLDKAVLDYYLMKNKDNKEKSLSFRPGPLHRLDRNTTGLLVFSMSLEGAKYFSEGIKNHTIQKKYYGIAQGNITSPQHWEDKIADSDTTEEGFHTVAQSEDGKLALTDVKPLKNTRIGGKDITLAEYSIKTGRKHQIRLQSQLHGYPLLGDKTYGGSHINQLKREYYLHAFCLTFPKENPLGLPQQITTPIPDDFDLKD